LYDANKLMCYVMLKINKKSTRSDNFTPTLSPPYTSIAVCVNFGVWVACWTYRPNQSCQISNRSVQGFRSNRWPKIAIFHWLEVSPVQQCRH